VPDRGLPPAREVGYYLVETLTPLIPHVVKRSTLLAPALALLSLASALATQAFAAQETGIASSPATLPPVASLALDKTKVSLPADFSAPFNLLILTFARDQQSALESWLPVSLGFPVGNPKIQTWVLPTSAKENTLYKWWLDSSMRSSLPAQQPQHFTVPLYVNKAQFLRALRIPSEKEVVILLTDKAGHVLWRSIGAATDEKKGSLAAFLKTQSP
jgi:hypothetical protein